MLTDSPATAVADTDFEDIIADWTSPDGTETFVLVKLYSDVLAEWIDEAVHPSQLRSQHGLTVCKPFTRGYKAKHRR